jgi:adenylosuccinate lyase
LAYVLENLVIYPDAMMKNLNKYKGLIYSQRILLALTQKGMSREDAYRCVQRNAMEVWDYGADFMTELNKDPDVSAVLSKEELEDKFDLKYHTKHVDTIFERVFKSL